MTRTPAINALQAQYRHRFSHGLQTLLSYTWAHSIDDASSDAYYLNVPPGDSLLSERGSSDYDIRHTFSGAISYNIPAPGSGIWKAIFGNWSTDSIVYARSRAPGECGHRTGSLRYRLLVGSLRRAASESGFRSAALDRRSERSRRKGNQSSGIHDTHRSGARRSGTKCPARIRRYGGRFDAAEAVQTPRAACSSGASGSFQHLQPPQFRTARSTISVLLNSGNRRRCWEPRSEAAARMAASIRCIKSADRARCNWL